MDGLDIASLPVREFAEVEPVLQQHADRVFGERILPAVPARAVTGSVERGGHLTIALAVGGESKGEQQSGVSLRIGDGDTVRVRLQSEREQAIEQPLRLPLCLALLRL